MFYSRKVERTKHLLEIRQMKAQTNAQIQRAIADGKAYLDTFVGRLKVTGYRHDTGWAVTGKDYMSQRSFLVCVTDIEIES